MSGVCNGCDKLHTPQILYIAYNLVHQSRLYFDDCKEWNKLPIGKNMAQFQDPFLTGTNPTMPTRNNNPTNGVHATLFDTHCTKLDDATQQFLLPCAHSFSASSPSPMTIMTSASSKELLKVNAASVHTTCGRGNHCYLGLILSAPVYNIVAPWTPFVIPSNPGLHLPHHGGTAVQIAQTLCKHTENLQQWKE